MLRLAFLFASLLAGPAPAEGFRSFAGHGGPVMGLAVAPDGGSVLTASFDYSVGLWPASDAGGPTWLEGHDAAVNTVSYLPGGRAVSGGDDYDAIVWNLADGSVLHRLEGHRGKVMGARGTPDGRMIATASWDGTVRLWNAETGREIAVLTDHDGPVNDVAWAQGGAVLYSAGHDGTVLEWDVAARRPLRRMAAHGFGVNVLAIDEAAGWLAYGALDGGTRVLELETGVELADLTGGRRPVLALARSPDGARIAIGDGEGYIMVVDSADWSIAHDFRAAVNGPIWALAFNGDGTGILAGGIADEAYLWPLDATGAQPRLAEESRAFHTDPDMVPNGERQFLRKCSVCHTLGPDGQRRAGPSLAGVFGRPAGSLPGYSYSPALSNSDIVWDEHSIDRLFEIGPDNLTPGSKMPMQQIASPKDRADLIAFLKRATTQD